MNFKKPKRFRSGEYLDFIRLKECCSCGAPGPSFAHHSRKLDPGRATQGKVSDLNCVPMCAICHNAEHGGYPMDELELWQAAFALLREFMEERLDD
jgi:hypothetical protein